ncbi:MAG: SPOR domain-containing protein [Bacteroidales bacterium]
MKRLLLISIMVIVAFNSCDFFQSKNLFSNDDDSVLMQKRQDSLKLADSIRTLHNELESLRQAHNRLLDSIKGEKPAKAQQTKGKKYHVIVGSFRKQEYLDSYNKFIQDKGFQTNILQNEFGFKLISVDSYNNWNDAVHTLEGIQEDLEETAWIYKQG